MIYKTAFFVVPTVELKNLKEVSYFEQGYTFYIIPIEAFEPILGAYRRWRITTWSTASIRRNGRISPI